MSCESVKSNLIVKILTNDDVFDIQPDRDMDVIRRQLSRRGLDEEINIERNGNRNAFILKHAINSVEMTEKIISFIRKYADKTTYSKDIPWKTYDQFTFVDRDTDEYKYTLSITFYGNGRYYVVDDRDAGPWLGQNYDHINELFKKRGSKFVRQ